MEGKNKIIVYKDWITIFDKLTDEEAGQLIKHFFNYINDLNPIIENRLLEILFEPIKQTLKRDLKKWELICERNKQNGLNGGRPVKSNDTKETQRNPDEPKKPSGLNNNPKNPNEPDSDIDSDKKIYIYSHFYDYEIENAKDKKEYQSYFLFVTFLFGKNPLNQKLDVWLKMDTQITYSQYEQLVIKARSKNLKISDKLLAGFNEPKYLKGKKSVYLTLNNWINRDEKRS